MSETETERATTQESIPSREWQRVEQQVPVQSFTGYTVKLAGWAKQKETNQDGDKETNDAKEEMKEEEKEEKEEEEEKEETDSQQ
ncbi:hypothetical protein DAKH74_045680 [Maudiozyma humilis]|uniref:Uncharacterized protein n=1 Tax=Maudiozyma humilis TaxID=51915 RepID=A0AAV5S547_MAUHU|nr:hypothetical protein DAKH74_045680 [Kazachstania humilis]